MNPIYKMFNYQYIQQQAQEKYFTQIAKVQQSANKLKDFFDSLDEIEPEYRNDASIEFSAIVLAFLKRNSN